MRALAAWLAALLALAGWPAWAGPVLLISLDGLRSGDVIGNPALPALSALQHEGVWADGVLGVWPALTYPSHATLITGASPARHTIGGNEAFDPTGDNVEGWMWYAQDLKADSLWSAARRAGLKTAALNWPVTVGAPIDYNLPQIWRARTEEDRKLEAALSTPGLRAELEALTGQPFPLGSDGSCEADARRAAHAAALIAAKRPDLTALHLECVDHLQHDFGPGSPQASEGLAQLDAIVGKLIAAARRELPGLSVVVVSDHGFAPVRTAINLGRAFREAGLSGTADWRAAVWPMSGSAAVVLRDPADQAARAAVRRLLARLARQPRLGIARIAEREEIVRHGGSRQAAFWVLFRPGFSAGGYSDGPLIQRSEIKGTHGYPGEEPAMQALLIASGPGLAGKGSLGRIDMRAIAPAIAARLEITLEHAELPAAF